MTFSIDVERAQYIQQVAARLGVPNSRLVDHLLAVAAQHVTAADLRAWAGSGQPRAPVGVALAGSEQRVYAVLTDAWQPLREVHGSTGQSERIAFRALLALEQRGLVEASAPIPTWARTPGRGVPHGLQWRRVARPG